MAAVASLTAGRTLLSFSVASCNSSGRDPLLFMLLVLVRELFAACLAPLLSELYQAPPTPTNKSPANVLELNPSRNHNMAMHIAKTRFPAFNKECVSALQNPKVIIEKTLYNGCHKKTCVGVVRVVDDVVSSIDSLLSGAIMTNHKTNDTTPIQSPEKKDNCVNCRTDFSNLVRSDNDTDWMTAVADTDVGASGGDLEVVFFGLPVASPEADDEC